MTNNNSMNNTGNTMSGSQMPSGGRMTNCGCMANNNQPMGGQPMGNQGMSRRQPMMHRGARSPYMPMDHNQFNPGCDQKSLMTSIYEYGFALIEAMLFLDTHPSDEEALAYYFQMREKYKAATAKYTELFGPLQFTDVNDENYWTWASTPNPWEMEG